MHRNFQSSPETVDFSSPGFADRINRQVLKFTDGRIRNFLPNSKIHNQSSEFMTNPLQYLQMQWIRQRL